LLDWLIEQQHDDGGWGDPIVPRARDVPTLAAMLALHTRGRRKVDREAIQSALMFMQRQSLYWAAALPDDLPVGIELLLPRLLDEAGTLPIAHDHYAALRTLGARRKQIIASRKFPAGTPPLHSWEAWGSQPETGLIDGSGGVGHSPTATARWLQASANNLNASDESAAAQRYLDQASSATGIAGVLPTVWPITRFEQSFALYFLLITGLLNHPALQDAVGPQIGALERAFRPAGIGMSDFFIADGDDTAAAVAVLAAAGRSVSLSALDGFALPDGAGFCAYPGELQHSPSLTAHALHAIEIVRGRQSTNVGALLSSQRTDGRWLGDKWNQSWLYTTSQALIVLGDAHPEVTRHAVAAVLTYQRPDGGWGTYYSMAEETAYALIALRAGLQYGGDAARTALHRGKSWLLATFQPFTREYPPIWLGKELYTPYRLVQIIIAAALAQAALEME
jgi:hypothetical protein